MKLKQNGSQHQLSMMCTSLNRFPCRNKSNSRRKQVVHSVHTGASKFRTDSSVPQSWSELFAAMCRSLACSCHLWHRRVVWSVTVLLLPSLSPTESPEERTFYARDSFRVMNLEALLSLKTHLISI